MGTILREMRSARRESTKGRDDALFRGVAGEDPVRLYDGDTELERLLILDARRGREPARHRRAARRRRGGRAHEVRRVDLDLVAPLRAHLLQRHLRVLQQDRVLHVPEAHADTGGVRHGVRAHAEQVGLEHACGRAQDELEGVFSVDL